MIKTVTLIPNIKKNISDEAICKVLDTLGDAGCSVSVSENCISPVYSSYGFINAVPDDILFDNSELIVVMGGDGSIISAARKSAEYGIPIVGINFGRLGYLAEIEIDDCALLKKIIEGNFKREERMMLDVFIERNGKEIRMKHPCLNEVVLSNGPISRLTELSLFCNGEKVTSYASDGIIISTPTGSSAYSLSAGGPLIYQTMECILATPICPHSLTLRPIVFTGDSMIEIKNPTCRENKMYITVDGRDNEEVFTDDIIRISKSSIKTTLVRVNDGGFVNVLNRKLNNKN